MPDSKPLTPVETPAEVTATPQPAAAVKTVPADQLFAGQREICIEHGGVRYWLRITKRNRLILQK